LSDELSRDTIDIEKFERQIDSKTIEKLNKKIDDIKCSIQIIIILIILIVAIQISQILENPDFLLYGSTAMLVTITVVFLIFAAIAIICTSDNQES